jgi:hypothetical protein
VRLQVGELGEEVFVDAPEDVAARLFQFLRVERPQQLAQHLVVQLRVFRARQHAFQALVILLDRVHRALDGLGAIGAVGQRHQRVELRLGPQVDRALLRKVFLGRRPCLAAAPGQIRLDAVLDGEIAAVGVPQENEPHHRQEILVAGVVGVGTQIVRGTPQAFLDRFDVF